MDESRDVALVRPSFARLALTPRRLALIAAAVVLAWRGILMLGPSRGIGLGMPLHFVALAAAPFVFLTRDGRQQIGITRRMSVSWTLVALFGGAIAALGIGLLGTLLYGSSPDNWFVTVRETTLSDGRLGGLNGVSLFVALAVPAAVFSPIGEELFFRGVLQDLLAVQSGQRVASLVTAMTFGVTHAFHHGVTAGPAGVDVRGLSAVFWVMLIAGLSLFFAFLRARTGSIWSPVLCHATFNVMMVAFIVTVLA